MGLIQNQGQRIIETDYWDSEYAQAGYFFLSWNAGAARLLMPDSQKGSLRHMRGAKEVIVSRGPWIAQGGRDAIELLWEDGSNRPFCLHLVAEQCDRILPATDQGASFVVAVWTRSGQKQRWPGKYRMVDQIPYLKQWAVQ